MIIKKNTQSSVEYLILFGITISIITILFSFFNQNYSRSIDEINRKKIENIQSEISKQIEKVYYTDEGSKRTISLNFPNVVNNLSVREIPKGKVLVISYRNSNRDIYSYFGPQQNFILFNLSSDCSYVIGNDTILKKTFVESGVRQLSFTRKSNFVEVHFLTNQTI